jgi:hypothetical protein
MLIFQFLAVLLLGYGEAGWQGAAVDQAGTAAAADVCSAAVAATAVDMLHVQRKLLLSYKFQATAFYSGCKCQ